MDKFKRAIKAKKSDTVTGEYFRLTLYLAKRGGNKAGPWLSLSHQGDVEAIAAMASRDVPERIQETYLKRELAMNPTFGLDEFFGQNLFHPNEEAEIHVLVNCPPLDRPRKHGSRPVRCALC